MADFLDTYQKEITLFFNDHYTELLVAKIYQTEGFVKEIYDICNKFSTALINKPTDINFALQQAKQFEKEISQKVMFLHIEKQTSSFKAEFPSLETQWYNWLNTKEETIQVTQPAERFLIQPTDSLYVKVQKPIKYLFYNVYRLPIQISNLWKRLSKKGNEEVLPIWHQKIPQHLFLNYFVYANLLTDLNSVYNKFLEYILTLEKNALDVARDTNYAFVKLYNQYLETHNINFADLTQLSFVIDTTSYVKYLRYLVSETITNVIETARLKFPKATTVELRTHKFGRRAFNRRIVKANKQFLQLFDDWHTTRYVLYERWRLHQELKAVHYTTLFEFERLNRSLTRRITEIILPRFNPIHQFIIQQQTELNNLEESDISISKLSVLKKQVENNLLNNIISQASEFIATQQLSNLLDRLESEFIKQISLLSKKRTIFTQRLQVRPVKNNELSIISPYELLTFEPVPVFLRAVKQQKIELIKRIDKVSRQIVEAGHILDFSLSSAIAALDKAQSNPAESHKTALEGVRRAESRLLAVRNQTSEISHQVYSEFSQNIGDFCKVFEDLAQIENILNLRLNIARTKALQRAQTYRKHIWENVMKIVPATAALFITIYKRTKRSYGLVIEKLDLSTQEALLTAELSDFLSQTETAVSKLPFVYQKLYKVEPLDIANFYEPRTIEHEKLQKAYLRWQNGHFSPAVVVSEKGSGSTTLINFFLKDKTEVETQKIIRATITKRIYEPNKFIEFLKNIFPIFEFDNTQQLVEQLATQTFKYIVVVEDLQFLFLRKVKGFDNLKLFHQLISQTNKQVFWITTCTLYAWNYLKRTIQIHDFFAYNIHLEALSEHEVVDLILKRHIVSGYDIRFEPTQRMANSKTYKRLQPNIQQEYLKDDFFKSLNRFTKSNISLALIFWLRSAYKVENDTIVMQSLDIDFSFLKSLHDDKLVLLHNLLLHELLTPLQMAQVLGAPENQAQTALTILADDGIVNCVEDTKYNINPLLYRQIVDILKSRNFLQ